MLVHIKICQSIISNISVCSECLFIKQSFNDLHQNAFIQRPLRVVTIGKILTFCDYIIFIFGNLTRKHWKCRKSSKTYFHIFRNIF